MIILSGDQAALQDFDFISLIIYNNLTRIPKEPAKGFHDFLKSNTTNYASQKLFSLMINVSLKKNELYSFTFLYIFL